MPDGDDITVNTPEGDRLHFPLGTDQQTIVAAMGKLKMQKTGGQAPGQAAPAPNIQSQPLQGPSGPTSIGPQPSMASNFLNRLVPHSLGEAATYNPITAPLDAVRGMIADKLKQSTAQVPGTGTTVGQATQNAGEFAHMAGSTALALSGPEAGAGLSDAPFIRWLTASKTAGAAALAEASAKAGSAPVELSPRTDTIIEKMVQRGKLGDKIPKVISDLLERVGPTTKIAAEAKPGPLTYDEARILQGNISSMTPEEQMSLKGAQKGLMQQLASSFSGDVQKAADAAGVGEQHSFGMQQYATASARNRTLSKVGKGLAAGAGIGGAGYVAERAIRKVAGR